MAKIDRVEDLPEWFDLKKYKGCESFRAVEWYRLLCIRCEILATLTNGASGVLGRAVIPLLVVYLEKKRNFPLDPMPDGCTFWEYVPSASALAKHQPVRTLTTRELFLQSHLDQCAAEDGICEVPLGDRWKLIADATNWTATHEALSDIPLEFRDHYLDEAPNAAALVQLSAPDSVLIAAFTNWLKRVRAQQPPETSKRERPAYKAWPRYGLLPYIDLLIWSKETGHQIPHNIMAQAVGYRNGGDSFRKTVPKLADDLMRNLAELEALAAIEARTEKPGA